MKEDSNLALDNIKPLIIDCELGINFVTHLYTLAKAGFYDKSYYSKFQNSIPPEDLEFLQYHSSLLAFDRRDHGKFTYSLFFVPAALNFQEKAAFEEYFTSWNLAVNNKKLTIYQPTQQILEALISCVMLLKKNGRE